MTFSLAVVDPLHGLLGAASASRSLAVGNAVLALDPSRGVTISQAATNRQLHGAMLHALGPGRPDTDGPVSADGAVSAGAAVPTPGSAVAAALASDDQPERRQCGVLDLTGRGAAHTGAGTVGWAGHRVPSTPSAPGTIGADGSRRAPALVLGNCLAGPEVLDAMADAVRDPASGEELARHLVDALLAGDAAGGDVRGRQSASVVVARIDREATWPFTSIVDLRVDDDPDAPAVLSRLLDAWIAAGAERRLVGRV